MIVCFGSSLSVDIKKVKESICLLVSCRLASSYEQYHSLGYITKRKKVKFWASESFNGRMVYNVLHIPILNAIESVNKISKESLKRKKIKLWSPLDTVTREDWQRVGGTSWTNWLLRISEKWVSNYGLDRLKSLF